MEDVKSFNEAMHTPRVRFLVGTDVKEYLVPKDLLAKNPLLPPDMTEPFETVVLLGVSPVVFDYFYYYLYHLDIQFPALPKNKLGPKETGKSRATDREQYVHELCQTWVFGDKYDVPGMQNCAMFRLCDVLHSDSTASMSADTMLYCYESTEPGTKLRNFVIDLLVRRLKWSASDLPPDIIDKMAVYEGFSADLLEAQSAWHKILVHNTDNGDVFCPRIERPLKFALRYEVDVGKEHRCFQIPPSSRARWRRATGFCDDCGSDNLFGGKVEKGGEVEDTHGRDLVFFCDACKHFENSCQDWDWEEELL